MADLGSQAIIHAFLSKKFPHDRMIAEESGKSLLTFQQDPCALQPVLSYLSKLLQIDMSLSTVSFSFFVKIIWKEWDVF